MFKYRYFLTTIGILLASVTINHGYCQEVDEETRVEAVHDEEAALAKATQNPVSDLISVPFQNNTNFGLGPHDRTQNVLNIQPVIPVSLSEDWNLINRTIAPVIYQPFVDKSSGGMFGLGDINHTAFLSPAQPGELIWGVGPIISFPTATTKILGTGKWSAGPSAVALTMQGPWVFGAIANNLWDFAGQSSRAHINQFLVQPFINFNLADGWYLVTAPIITANWKAESSERWIVPAGAGFGKVLMIGSQPINASAHGYYNVEKPDGAADWTLRLQIQLLFPTS
jgi:hypothetical protein